MDPDDSSTSSALRRSIGPSHELPTTTLSGCDVAPFEPWVCELLTLEIRRHMRGGDAQDETNPDHLGLRTSTLESAINNASQLLQQQAKWFTPQALARLLGAVCEAKSTTSSATLQAALHFVNTAFTYALLPVACISEIVRFLAQAYYSASRAQRTRKLGAAVWSTVTRLLESHIGELLVEAFLTALSDNAESRSGFSTTTGALMLMLEMLRSRKEGMPLINPTILILRLEQLTSRTMDAVILEHVAELLAELLASDARVSLLRGDGGWSKVLNVALQCSRISLLSTLLGLKDFPMEPSAFNTYFELCLQLGHEMTEESWRSGLAHRWPLAASEQKPEHYRALIPQLFAFARNEQQLRALSERGLITHQLLNGSHSLVTIEMGRAYAKLLKDFTTSAAVKHTLAEMLIQLYLAQPNQPIFDLLCEVASFSFDVASFLFGLRADITGVIYTRYDALSERLTATGTASITPNPTLMTWHAAILNAFRRGADNWDVYHCFLQQTKYLVGNHTFFAGQMAFIKEVQATIRGVLQSSSFTEPPLHTGLGKAYIISHLIQTLVASLSYHRAMSQDEITDLVSLFNDTAGSRDHTVSIACIHALTVCCYEVPDIMSKYMEDVVDKMTKMVTQRYLAIHVLQFLSGLSRLPDLYHNFTVNDYKKIFAVCYNYLQTTRGVQTIAERRQTPTSERSSATTKDEEAFPEYVYALAHHVITFWYMSLQQQHRDQLKPYITGCLTYDVDGQAHIEDQGLVTVDMMDRKDAEASGDITSSLNGSNLHFDHWEGRLVERQRLAGMLLISTKTSLRSGRSLVTVRRPSGTTHRLVTPAIGSAVRTKATVQSDVGDFLSIVPADDHGITYGTITVPSNFSTLGTGGVVTLPEDDAVTRAIRSFDRTSALDSHKAGVMYIGERQTTADRVFLNISGSTDYREFVSGLGTVERLKGAGFNTQGLDRSNDADGEHVMVWRYNDVTELVYHVTTMMPNDDDTHENTGRKKRHVGNDHVTIIFNNSGIPHDFNTLYNMFPGQLTYVYIVIAPSARTNFMQARTENVHTDKRDRFYTVQVFTRPDYPNLSAAAEEKVVSGASLPGMVRSLALNECIMSLMWTQRNDSAQYPSSWRSRMDQLRRLRERYGGKAA
ncbi:hypothetical protein BAUCODRAFT_33548 [Baudoinia panamericana UAMH 10762]|uniref:Rap-GAP domain-containing protein n=1 Tax=Baudoinia panamericana (strain UAMH 10762) TaxID=717646 RepID=M2NAN2_BAUPA|nr:uncharacterized protein BAUCODRAFT_33548 [Baudoinia panamericana UAMH 10762]EMC96199.1 hypothetical protein BAUCODRAFT_33548 [Baudoinia panamericana UAMH 10762]